MSDTYGNHERNGSSAVVAGAGLLVLVGCTSSMVGVTGVDDELLVGKAGR